MIEFVIREWQPSEAQRSDRSAGDRARHRHKVREAIRENIADIIAEESIIGRNNDKIIKVPIRGIKEYRFVYGDNNNPQVGEGNGDEQTGQVIGQGDDQQQGEGQAGDQKGVDYYETDVSLEELIDIMFEDLELPFQERKKLRNIETDSNRKKIGYRKKGVRANLSHYRTALERVRRMQGVKRRLALLEQQIEEVEQLLESTRDATSDLRINYSRELAFLREKHAETQALLNNSADDSDAATSTEPAPRFPFRESDLRYHHHRNKLRPESNAVVICIMDTSGSMDTLKKYLARSFFFLLFSFVRTKYDTVEVVFVAHSTEAQEVTEEEFFTKGQSGGTYISSGYNKALEIMQERYHPSLWNVYAFHCSDGDNFPNDNQKTAEAALELCENCNLFGYGEIKPNGKRSYENSMLSFFEKNIDADNFRSLLINGKEDIWNAFRDFLSAERGAS